MATQKFISEADEKDIIDAIRTAEKRTSGEIRVHIEPRCQAPIKERAQKVFHELKMDNTKLENGVLIYLAVEDHQFYVLGDRGINAIVGANFWETTKDIMQNHFKKGDFKQGLIDGILRAGEQLQKHFPWSADHVDELSNEISRGE